MVSLQSVIDFSPLQEAEARTRSSAMSIAERWEQIVMLADMARVLELSSPNPAGLKRVRDFNESAWQRANSRLFERVQL